MFAPVATGSAKTFEVSISFELPSWKLQNENKCLCLNNTRFSALNIFGISVFSFCFFSQGYCLHHLTLKTLQEHLDGFIQELEENNETDENKRSNASTL